MTQIWIYSLISVLIVSFTSFLGILTIVFKKHYLKGFLLFMVSFAAGTLLGDVFLHLLPELISERGFSAALGLNIIAGILIFFVLEKIVHWRHCHLAGTQDHTHSLAVMNLVGDGVHNFIDGVLIAGSFLFSIPVGIATTVAVVFHEIPQEMGDFGVLLHAGLKVKKALFLNFLSALAAVLGVLVVLAIGIDAETTAEVIIPITIGGFLYIANSDLIPELHKDVAVKNSIIQLVSFLIGVALMAGMLFIPFAEAGHDHSINGEGHNEIHETAN
ncbi:ZIP family metal transporter [Patescibacteria group bacterium]|nr:ZIP family metal transporter [Patescibacteria group bacterium]MBU1685315.1 ZIP family metal transporter [Patescibacteria group bacterium]MBU1938949.1 ZIP family metal transporter [Patescibacteria group bacterium]